MLIPLLSTQNCNKIFATMLQTLKITICISLLLILSGHIIINPGPTVKLALAAKKLINLPSVFAAITVIYGFTSLV